MSLELHNIHKAFGPVRANDGVTLTVEAGELHGLLGENGAGKSTLMKVLSGFIEADDGSVTLDGERLSLGSPRDAIRAGIGMLHQDPLVFGPFSVLDNFLLGSPSRLRLDRRAGAAALEEACDRYGFSFDPNTLAQTLTVGERQQLEIARLIWLGARVLIRHHTHRAPLTAAGKGLAQFEGQKARLGVANRRKHALLGIVRRIRRQAGIEHGNRDVQVLKIARFGRCREGGEHPDDQTAPGQPDAAARHASPRAIGCCTPACD